MKTGKTSSGFGFSVDERVLNDWRFAMAAKKSLSDDPNEQFCGAMDMVDALLGKDQTKALEKHISGLHEGFIPQDVMFSEVEEIMRSVKEIKNC